MSDRVPPHSLPAEKAVLGGILLANPLLDVVMDVIKPEDFYGQGNGIVYETMIALNTRGSPIDTTLLTAELEKAGKLNAVGGLDYVLALTDTIPEAQNVKAHAGVIKETALVRRLITVCQTQAAKAFGDYGEYAKFVDETEKMIFDVCSVQTRNVVEHVKIVIERSFEAIASLGRSGERISGLRSGFNRVDEYTAGMHPGDLIIVAGRPGMGKTSYAMNVAVNAAFERKHKQPDLPGGVAIFSLEMPKEQLTNRMLASEGRVDAGRMRTGRLTLEDFQGLTKAADTISQLPIFLDDTAAISMMEIRAKGRRLMAEHGLCLIVIDYLQLMRAGVKTDSREQEISEISRGLKSLAKELGIPIIALSQLNRSVESRADKRPQLSDLRESGAIEQDADTIMFVYRDEVYDKNSDARGIAELVIGKQRAGPTGIVKVRFFNEYTRFDNLSDEVDDEPIAS